VDGTGSAVLGIVVAIYLASWVLKQDPGNEKMQEISKATQEGALAFLCASTGSWSSSLLWPAIISS
jgi:Na+/H+-translocating membrane pyrophosphatase